MDKDKFTFFTIYTLKYTGNIAKAVVAVTTEVFIKIYSTPSITK